MKKAIVFLSMLLFIIGETNASTWVSSRDQWPLGFFNNAQTSFQVGCFFGNSACIFTNGATKTEMFECTYNDEGKIVKTQYNNWATFFVFSDNMTGSCCVYDETLYYFGAGKEMLTPKPGQLFYWAKKVDKVLNYQPNELKIGDKLIKRTASVGLIDSLMLIYIDESGNMYSTISKDIKNWSNPYKIDQGLMKSEQCNVAAVSFLSKVDNVISEYVLIVYNTGKSTPDKGEDNLKYAILNKKGEVISRHSASFPNLCFVEACYGTVKGGGTGNRIQIFLSAMNTSAWQTSSGQTFRTEYDINGNTFSEEYENLHTAFNLDSRYYKPVAVSNLYFHSNALQNKRITLTAADFIKSTGSFGTNYLPYFSHLCWDSNKLRLDSIKSVDGKKDKWHFIGAVEGAPPYVLNGDKLDSIVVDGTIPSSIQLTNGTINGAETTNTNTTSYSFECGGSGYHWGHSDSETNDTTITTEVKRTITPVPEINYGYRFYIKPVFNLQFFSERDWRDSCIDRTFILLSFKGDLETVELYDLDTAEYAPRHSDFHSWMYLDDNNAQRSGFLNNYLSNAIFSTNVEWASGSDIEVTFEIEETKITTTEQFKGHDIGLIVDFFHISSGFVSSFDYSFERTVTSTTKNGVTVMLDSRHGYREGDTNEINTIFYWIKPVNDMPSYWAPDEFKNQNPWLMTYAVDKVQIREGGIIADAPDYYSQGDILAIYPNPASEIINIINAEGETMIVDIFGKTVWKGIVNNNRRISTSSFGNGLYYAISGNQRQKFIINR